MRNFKKFLALVLAMLMVSACAVSVSAYADQAAINASGYAEAVEVLSTLGVIAGDGTNFNPNGTLTRAAAAKIVATLTTGAAGQKIEWTSTTSSFVDVDPAHWGNAYINYASQHGYMDGIGGGKFAPDANLTIAEAIVIAVKAAGLRKAVADLDEFSKPAYWATNWIAVAGGSNEAKIDLTDNVTVFDYTASCSRAMFAQIAYNMLNKVEKISDGFGLEKISAKVISVADNKVTLEETKYDEVKKEYFTVNHVVGLGAFNAAMTAAGIEGTAEVLKGSIITLTYSEDANVIYGVALDSNAAAYTYADGKIVNVLDSDNNLTDKITIDGVTYVVGGTDNDDKSVIGSTASTKGIKVTVDGKTLAAKEALPTYFAAVAYDDDADGDFDRLVMDEYKIATVKYNTKDKNSDGVTFDTIKYIDGTSDNNHEKVDDKERAINYTGVAIPNEETPILVNFAYNTDTAKYDVDVLEVAATVTGKLTGVAAKYVKIDGTNYEFVANSQKIENWTLNQTVSFYTIGGKFVKFTTASYADIEVVVNSAVVTDGKAVITGYNKSANYADITVTVEGIKDESGRLVSKIGYQHTDKDKDDKDYNTVVSVGYVKSDNTFVPDRTFNEGEIVTLRQIKDGAAYVISADNAAFIASTGTATSAVKFEVKNGYIYTASDIDDDLVATAYAASDIVILEYTANADLAKAEKTDSYDYINYNKLSTYAARKNVNYNYVLKDGKTSFVYVAGSNALTTITKSAPLAEGQAIVYVYNFDAIESAFDHSVYEAVNLMTGEKITVKDTSKISSANVYYVIDADNNVVEVCEFIGTKFIAKVDYTGHIGVIKAKATVETYNSADKSTDYIQEGDDLTFGLDTITIYNKGILDGKKNVSKADVQKTLLPDIDLEEKVDHNIAGDIYVVAGQMIIVLK